MRGRQRLAAAATLAGALLAAQELRGQTAGPAIETLLRELDERFVRGDVAGYLAHFTPDNPGALSVRGRQLERLVRASRARKRTSSVVSGPARIGDRALLRVRRTIELVDAAGATRRTVEDSLLALRDDGTPTFSIEAPTASTTPAAGRFTCDPCNVAIGGVDGFLCVPLRAERTLSLESTSFYLIGTDVACDVHVQIQPHRADARRAARALAEAFARLEPRAEVGLATAWRPPAYETSAPARMDSARVAVTVPGADRGDDGDRAIFHVVTIGSLQHVLVTRGSAAALATHARALDALYQSYALVEAAPERDAAARPLRYHLGSVLEGNRYENARYGVSFAGPAGWRAEHRVGGARFRARWSASDGSQLWLAGYGPPAGIDAWTTANADRWIAHRLDERGLRPLAEQPAELVDAWRPDADGAATRAVALQVLKPSSPTAPRRRVLHVQVHQDLLLILDGYGATEASERALLNARRSLQRAR